jgi:hypothetical protein
MVRAAFALEVEYLKTDVHGAIDYMDYGLALGRRFRALKLWFFMRYFGREGLVAILRRSMAMAAWLGERISGDARFDLAAPVNMGLVCFRSRHGNEATKKLMNRINDGGVFFRLSHRASRQFHHSCGHRKHPHPLAGCRATVGHDLEAVSPARDHRRPTRMDARRVVARAWPRSACFPGEHWPPLVG